MSDYMSGYEEILVDTPETGLLLITLNRPKARNALNTTLLTELADVLDHARKDDAIRAVILTGGEKVFAAGADITELARHDRESITNDPRKEHWSAIRNFPKPVIAAVNGYCLGGGNELAMQADVIIAGENALFGQPEINLGIIPGAGGTQRLLHAVGKSKAMEMVLAGTMINANEAKSYGLISAVIPPELTLEHALKLARTIAGKSPLALQAAKQSVLQAYETSLSDSLAYERSQFESLFDSKDMKEGVQAFIQKRKPVFRGE